MKKFAMSLCVCMVICMMNACGLQQIINTEEQSTEEQSTEEQSTEEQSTEEQLIEEQPTEEQGNLEIVAIPEEDSIIRRVEFYQSEPITFTTYEDYYHLVCYMLLNQCHLVKALSYNWLDFQQGGLTIFLFFYK